MSVPMISVQNVSKSYKLGLINRHTLVEESQYWWARLRRRQEAHRVGPEDHAARDRRRYEEEAAGQDLFYALNDVSFDVAEGEVLGVIGTNGAGKSTLLKILSKITAPSSGTIDLYGRVASLLEVGTGFHPELTGRENVFMNGTLLGMKAKEVEQKFDEIVDFSGVEAFIDTPVKRYSSGMQVRLAFAVAAHLEPEILLIDEVLAVGDAAFQKRCLGKMEDVSQSGRTILFVSHNISAINRLCSRGILLEDGRIVANGETQDITSQYYSVAGTGDGARYWDEGDAPGRDGVQLRSVEIMDLKTGSVASSLATTQEAEVRLIYRTSIPDMVFRCVVEVHRAGVTAFMAMEPTCEVRGKEGEYMSSVRIPEGLLRDGEHTLAIYFYPNMNRGPRKRSFVAEHDVLKFFVFDTDDENSARGDFRGKIKGAVMPRCEWNLSYNG